MAFAIEPYTIRTFEIVAKQRIYIDTSVFGGYFDKEFEVDTRLFFDSIFKRDFVVYISEISNIELLPAPAQVQKFSRSNPKRLPGLA